VELLLNSKDDRASKQTDFCEPFLLVHIFTNKTGRQRLCILHGYSHQLRHVHATLIGWKQNAAEFDRKSWRLVHGFGRFV
jgi:acetoacetate decarboxylase